jgi:hypothetical protein
LALNAPFHENAAGAARPRAEPRASPMPKLRIIPRLEVKSENVVKGIRMEGLRVVGRPADLSARYALIRTPELMTAGINNRSVE